ncbi:MAG: CDP-alcohol phosphatidyltransferase family protein [Bacteroidales bacterium]
MIKNNIPNILTICNLLCGSLAVLVACSNFVPLEYAAYLIFLGAFFDYSDGFAARILNAYSPMGKELDSLADLITFGFAPSAIVIAVLQHIIFGNALSDISDLHSPYIVFIILPLMITAFSAIRLAKFNIDESQTSSFSGLATPASALFFAGLVFHDTLVFGPWFIIGAVVLMSGLMISNIPMFSLKISSLSFSQYPLQILFGVFSIIAFVFLQFQAISLIIGLYILTCIILWLFKPKKQ